MNILDRKFIELDQKSQVLYNKQKNEHQDLIIKSQQYSLTELQNQIIAIQEGAVSSYLPLIWTREPDRFTYRLNNAGLNYYPVGSILQLIPLGADSKTYISALVEVTAEGIKILLEGDYEANFTEMNVINTATGAYSGTTWVELVYKEASNLSQYPADENKNTRVKVMHDSDGAMREYVSVDWNGDGDYTWIRYGTINNGLDGNSVFSVNESNFNNTVLGAKAGDTLIAAESFFGYNSGDVIRYDGDNNFTVIGNIRGAKGEKGNIGEKGDQGNAGFMYIATNYYELPIPALDSTRLFVWSNTFNAPYPTKTGDYVIIKYVSGGREHLLMWQIQELLPDGYVNCILRSTIASTGVKGDTGAKGVDGVSISSVTSSKVGKTTTVLVSLSNSTTATFDIKDGEDAEPFVIAEGVFTVGSLPSFNSASVNTGYVVLDTSPPSNTYDLYIKTVGASDWTIVEDWGGVPGQTGLKALTTTFKGDNDPTMGNTLITNFNRTPAVGDNFIFLSKTRVNNASITAVTGNYASFTVDNYITISDGKDGTSNYTLNMGNLSSMPVDMADVEFNPANLSPANLDIPLGTRVFTVMYVNSDAFIGFGTITDTNTIDLSGITPFISSTLFENFYNSTNLSFVNGVATASIWHQGFKNITLNTDIDIANDTAVLVNDITYTLNVVGSPLVNESIKPGLSYPAMLNYNLGTITVAVTPSIAVALDESAAETDSTANPGTLVYFEEV